MRRGQMGCLWMIIKPVLTFAAVVAVIAVVAFPWAIPLPSRATLNGEWSGELRSSSGPRARLYMNLRMASGYTTRIFSGRTRLGGNASLCTRRRRIDLSIAGYTTTWSGESVDLLLRPIKPSRPELRLDVLGKWDGHTLELRESDRSLEETLNEPNAIASVESPSSSQWIAATLSRGTRARFDAECTAAW